MKPSCFKISAIRAFTDEDGIATLTMDDGKANVMSVAMLQSLNAALDRAGVSQNPAAAQDNSQEDQG